MPFPLGQWTVRSSLHRNIQSRCKKGGGDKVKRWPLLDLTWEWFSEVPKHSSIVSLVRRVSLIFTFHTFLRRIFRWPASLKGLPLSLRTFLTSFDRLDCWQIWDRSPGALACRFVIELRQMFFVLATSYFYLLSLGLGSPGSPENI